MEVLVVKRIIALAFLTADFIQTDVGNSLVEPSADCLWTVQSVKIDIRLFVGFLYSVLNIFFIFQDGLCVVVSRVSKSIASKTRKGTFTQKLVMNEIGVEVPVAYAFFGRFVGSGLTISTALL